MFLKKYKHRQTIIQYLYRKKYIKIYNLYFILKLIIKNNYIEKQFKVLAVLLLINISKSSFISYHKNVCLKSGYKKVSLTFFKLNRLSVLDNLDKFIFPGINKTIW